MNPLVTIIVLNWNGWQDTLECLESLYQINYPHYQVILVDNHSQDQSLEKIREYCQGKITVKSSFFDYNSDNKPIEIREITKYETEQLSKNKKGLIVTLNSTKKLTLIKNDVNYGFAEGNNIAIRYAQKSHDPEYILLLNNDTVVKSDFLTKMVGVAESDVRIGMVSGKLLNAHNPHIIDSTGHVISWGRMVDRGHGKVDHKQYDGQNKVMGVMAAAALYKREMLKDTGLLDISYVTLGEDADLSWRAHNRGWKAIYVPNAIIYHKRGRSITKQSVIPKMTILSLKNTVEYVTRYGNAYQKILFKLLITKEGLYVLVGSIIGKNDVDAGEYLAVLMRSYLKIFKSFFRKNQKIDGKNHETIG
jgi:GT2 family glycosyltransferase